MGSTPRVLVVDDERIIADTLTRILDLSGFDARAAYSGEMAVEIALDFKPHMLVSDVVMPGTDGIDAAIRVCTIIPSCKVLLFSGQSTSVGLLKKALAQHYEFELLMKPVHPNDLLAKLRKVLF